MMLVKEGERQHKTNQVNLTEKPKNNFQIIALLFKF